MKFLCDIDAPKGNVKSLTRQIGTDSNYYYERHVNVPLSDNTDWTVIPELTFPATSFDGCDIGWELERYVTANAQNETRKGWFICAHDQTDAWLRDDEMNSDGVGIDILGVDFDVAVTGGNFVVKFKTSNTGYNCSFRALQSFFK